MTISSTTRVAGPFIGSGTVATFPFSFKVFSAVDVYVVTLNVATGAITVLALTANYTVALNPDQDSAPGGTITLTAGNLATGMTLTITTEMAQLQGLDLANGGGFYPDVINAALDTLTILVQQLQVQVSQALQIPLVDGALTVTLPAAAERAGNLLAFDAAGKPLLIPLTGSGAGAVPTAQAGAGTINSVNKLFTFVAPAGATPVVQVYAGGIFQTPTTDYSLSYISGTTWQVGFVNAPALGPITVLLF
jgi:hypothetical protein